MGYCKIHGQFEDDVCPDCVEAEDRAETDRATMLEKLDNLRQSTEDAAGDLAYAVNNPGDHPCPHCKLRTLLLKASRCPKCRGVISAEYWSEARRRMERKKQVDQDRQARWREELRERSIAEKQEADAAEVEAYRKRRNQIFLMVYCWYLVPVLFFISLVLIAGVPAGARFHSTDFVPLVPGLNWILAGGMAFAAPANVWLTRVVLGFWLFVGFVIKRLL
jgi:hypothetical protein